VTLLCQPGQLKLRISDDGCGFEPDDIPFDHLGLGIMRERAADVGAKLSINSCAASGTEVVVVWTDKGQNASFAAASSEPRDTR
jgi:nitrate/nitrite-specific signal transduction histidine kinase